MKDNFYVLFEESFRGSRGLILDRLSAYDDFLVPMQSVHRGGSVVDLGCGRCEWIEKMQAMGFAAQGVDLDGAMLESGRDRGLNVHQGDALTYLHQLPESSQAIISAFHLVEHISFEQLRDLLEQAQRVLKPAGLLIIETPNPENLHVATQSFYLDPTHLRPVPLELLTFLPKLAGFERIKLVRLQEAGTLRTKSAPSLADVIGGASPDYAVIVQKDGTPAELELFQSAFEKDYGLSLQTLLERYDHSIQSQFKVLHIQMQTVTEQLQKALELTEASASHSQRTMTALHQLQVQLQAVYSSRSWRITAPLRWANAQLRKLIEQGVSRRVRLFVRKMIGFLSGWFQRRPRLKRQVQKILHAVGLYAATKAWLDDVDSPAVPVMTPRAKQIKKDLQKAMSEMGDV